MFCPSCGKEVPDGSRFCLHCGSSIAIPSNAKPTTSTQWDYKDFVYSWTDPYWYRPNQGETELHARLWFWGDTQSKVLPELQKWRDKGWETITEVGPSAFVVTYKSNFLSSRYETLEFRVKCRRPQNTTPSQEKEKETTQLNIKRLSGFVGMAMAISVYIDNQKIGSLANGESKTFEIPKTASTIHVRQGFKDSSKAPIDHLHSGGHIFCECSTEMGGARIRVLSK